MRDLKDRIGRRDLKDRIGQLEGLLALATVVVITVVYEWRVQRGTLLPGQGGDGFGLDFRDTVWFPLRVLMAGGDPWNAPVYHAQHPWAQNFPPYAPLYWPFMAPFLVLPYRIGLGLWVACSVAALVALVWVTLRRLTPVALGRHPWLLPAVCVLVAFTRPGRAGLTSANWATFCSLAAVLVLLGLPAWRGSVAGAVALIKPQAGLPLIPMLVLRGDWGQAVRTCLLAGVLCLPGLGLVTVRAGGLDGLLRDIHATLAIGDGRGNGPGTTGSTRMDVLGTLGHAYLTPSPVAALAILCVAGLLTLGGYALAVQRGGTLHPLSLALGGLGLVVVLPNQVYSVPVLVPALVALAVELWRCPPQSPMWAAQALLLLLLFVPFANTGRVFSLVGVGVVRANLVTGTALACATVLAVLLLFLPPLRAPEQLRARTDA